MIRVLFFLFAAPGIWPSGPEGDVRRVLSEYMAAVRQGGPKQLQFLSKSYRVFLTHGHVFERTPGFNPDQPRGQSRSQFVVSMHFPRPDIAVVAANWHDSSAKPPFDSGLADYTLLRDDGKWKIATSRDRYLPSPDSVVPASPAAELKQDWEPLFDGKTSEGWITVTGASELPASWRIDDGCLVTTAGKPMSLRTRRQFGTFELAWEWKAARGANSGLKYRLYAVRLSPDGTTGDAAGYEYQVADDTGDPGARVDPTQRSGSLYGVTPMHKSGTRLVGEWNDSRVVVARDHVEHWLNGVETARHEVDVVFASPISLQHHNSEVRFRNLRIRRHHQ